MKENQVEKIMKALGCTREEAEQVIEDDKAIDKGEKLFQLTEEQEKASKKARGIGTKTQSNKPRVKREKKTDNDKAMLIETIKQALMDVDGVTNIEITNSEREMTLTCNERKFKIVLSAPRT